MTRANESHWVYGNGAHIHFPSCGDPVAKLDISSTGFSPWEGCAAISDDTGTLLFYTDGSTLWDRTNTPVQTGLGGHSSSTHSAIIVPPAGGGAEYHVFAVGSEHDDDLPGGLDLITHSSYTVKNGTVAVANHPLAIGTTQHSDATERLAATSHALCDKYWVAAQNQEEKLILFLVEGDVAKYGRPNASLPASPQPWANPTQSHEVGQMKFSPNGEYLAYCDTNANQVVVLDFVSAVGDFTHRLYVAGVPKPYGLEFSPNSKMLYYSAWNGKTWQADLAQSGTVQNSAQYEVTSEPHDKLSQLQLGPNDRIYGALYQRPHLAVIQNPDIAGAGCNFLSPALDAATGTTLDTGAAGQIGLPTFTRIADKCLTPNCAAIAEEVDDILWEATAQHHESMQPCDYRTTDPRPHPRKRVWPHPKDTLDCEPLPFERPAPSVYITHSDSDCDCLESDDVEVMNITVCNRYSNILLTDLTIQSIELVGPNGGPPTPLPDGSPSVEVAPMGPFCFGDIEPCSCVSRQFVLRLRGAVAGSYKIKVTAMCFSWQVSESQQRCFEFEVCAD